MERERVQRILNEVDSSGSGSLEFRDFLALMRKYRDERDAEVLQREESAAAHTGFTRDEVEQFRVIFRHGDTDKSGDLSLDEIVRMLRTIVPVGSAQLGELAQIVKDVDEDGNREIDFPEFLHLMGRVQELNHA